jgi:hypothetical protein
VAKSKAPKKNAAGAAKKPTESLLVGSKVKAAIKGNGCNTGGDVLDSLNAYAHWLVGQATTRAQSNGRKTVRGHDIILM